MLEIIKKIANENPKGFTISIETFNHVRFGISVAFIETQNCFNDEGLAKCIDHAKANDGFVGGWENEDETMQYDSVKIFINENEAKEFGIKNKQRAIYNIHLGKEIKL